MPRTLRIPRAFPWFASVSCLLAGGVTLFSASSSALQYRLPAGRAVQVVSPIPVNSGSPDLTFGLGGHVISDAVLSEYVQAMVVQADGKVLVVGHQNGSGDVPHFVLRRFSASGKPDLSFGAGGLVVTTIRQDSVADQASAVAVQADGKILVAGYVFSGSHHSDFALVRYTSAGALDSSFGAQGKAITTVGNGSFPSGAHAVVVQPDGRILVVGTASSGREASKVALLRYTASGSLDPSFGDHGVSTTAVGSGAASDGEAMVLLKDGRILVAGSSGGASSVGGFALLRYLTGGKLDPSFGKQGKVMTVVGLSSGDQAASARAVSVLPDGGILLAGEAWVTVNGEPAVNVGLAKYHADGSLDRTFGAGGSAVTTGLNGVRFQALTALPSGKFLMTVNAFLADSVNNYSLVRYLPTGNPDVTYGGKRNGAALLGGTQDIVQIASSSRQPDGKVIIAGTVDVKGVSRITLARFNP